MRIAVEGAHEVGLEGVEKVGADGGAPLRRCGHGGSITQGKAVKQREEWSGEEGGTGTVSGQSVRATAVGLGCTMVVVSERVPNS